LGDFQPGRLSRARSAGCRTHLSHAPSRTSRSLQNTKITTTTRTEKKTRERKKNLLPKINREKKCCIGNPFYPRGIQARLPSSIRIVIEDG
jgi:hypothetical protein